MEKIKVIAYYLAQYHPIPENDEWWGKGFTEWTNVGRAKPLFPGHYQPKVPADLGYYDLRISEVREQQVVLAREAGIEGFCYWHYWFGDKKELLEKPFKAVLESGKPDFPFCLAWANESWYKKSWTKDGLGNVLLIEQKYGGEQDYVDHFYSVLPAFKDSRYIKIDGKPVFVIYRPYIDEELKVFIKIWNNLALKEGLKGIYWIAHCVTKNDESKNFKEFGYDAVNVVNMYSYSSSVRKIVSSFLRHILRIPYCVRFSLAAKLMNKDNAELLKNEKIIPSIVCGWDHTPRSGRKGNVLTHYTPKAFKDYISNLFTLVKNRKSNNEVSNIVFLKSWNEWGEGNYIEPDLKYGKAFLDVLKEELKK